MQNHTNYNRDNYPDDERVHVVSHPVGLKSSTVGALEDFATGIRDADAMLGKLTAYFSQVDEPVILVFWGDHYNPIDSNYDVYTTTGYASGSSTDPRLHQTTLLMWSNYSQQQVDFGATGSGKDGGRSPQGAEQHYVGKNRAENHSGSGNGGDESER